MKILIIEDDQAVTEVLQIVFTSYNYVVDLAADGDVGLQMAQTFDYDLILLDVIIQQLDGLSLCQQLRRKGFEKPIILLTGKRAGDQKAIALKAGANDYLVKPFETEELMTRVQSWLERGSGTNQRILTWGCLSIDPSNCQVAYNHQFLSITTKEYGILELFLRNPHRVLSSRVILEEVWTSLELPTAEAVRFHIKELRRKLTETGAPKDFIKTRHRLGYQLNPLYASSPGFKTTEELTKEKIAELKAINEQLRSAQAQLQQQHQELQVYRQQLELQMTERTAELQEREELLSSIYNSVQQPIFVVDVTENQDFLYLSFNPSAQQFLGVSLQDIKDKTPEEVFGSEFGPIFRKNYQRCLQAANIITYEEHFIFQERPIWTLTTLSPLRNQAGRIYRLVGTVSEISDRKQAEIELRQREEFLSSIYHGADQAIFVVDVSETNNFRFLGFNHLAEDFAGASQEDIQGKTPEEAFGSIQGAVFRRNYERCLKAGRSISYEEKVVVAKHTIWTLTTLSPLRNEQGKIHRLVGTAIDITERKQLEFALQASEAKLNQVLDSAIASIVSFRVFSNYDWEYDYWSAGCESLFGYTREEFMADKTLWMSRVYPDDQQTIIRQLFEVFFAESNVSAEYRFCHKDGSIRWISGTYTSKQIAPGCWSITVVNYDISDRKQAEESLRENEQKYHQILDSIVDMVFVKGPDSRLIWANKAFQDFYGMTLEELQSIFDASLNNPEYTPLDLQDDAYVLATGQTRIIPQEPIRRHDGVVRLVNTIKAPICNEAGQVVMLVVVCRDMTDQIRAEEDLQASERKLRAIFDSTFEFMGLLTKDGILIDANRAALNFVGAELADVVGQPFWETQWWTDSPEQQQQLQAAIARAAKGEFVRFETNDRRGDGSLAFVDFSLKPIFDELGNVLMLVPEGRDITDRKQAELTLQQQMRQEYLLADMAQDIRQSLNLDEVLASTVHRVREFLKTDRVIIFRFRPNWHGDVIVESVGAEWLSILSTTIFDPCLGDYHIETYQQGRIATISDIDQEDLKSCYVEFLKSLQVKANLVVPILQGDRLWGLLIAHQCSGPRQWQSAEISLLRRLATQAAIAIQQSELYEQTRQELVERQRIQAVLEESEELFRALSAAAPIGILQTNAEGICLYSNAQWQHLSGLNWQESLGYGWLQAIHPEDRKMVLNGWENHLQIQDKCRMEFRLLTPEQETRWVVSQPAAIRSAKGEIIGHVCVYGDITERKQAEQKIREQATLLDIASDAIFVHDLNNRILYWNQGAERLYGWQAAEVIGQEANAILHNLNAQFSLVMTSLLAEGEWRGEVHNITKTGEQVIVEARWTLVRDEANQPKYILTVDTDITAKKHLEAQFYRAQRLESLGTLASGIAHDLNNVLTPILSIAQLLQLQPRNLDGRAQEMLKILEDSAKRGANMIKQILTFTRGKGGDRSLIEVASLLEETIHIVRQSFPKSIKIRQSIPRQFPWFVSADPTYLHQVFMNLCVNARDAMADGGILSFAVEHCFVEPAFAQVNLDAQVGNYVVVTIGDTGIGIPLEVRDRIFEPFFTTKAQGQGTGLGLATVLGIVKNYGGFLQVFSEVGQGTQVKVYLPATEARKPDQGIATNISEPQEQFRGKGELILLVDDDLAVQQGTQALLENHQFTTILANDGVGALKLYSEHQAEITVVILDIMMPDMDGISLIQRLKVINPMVKIIAMSGLTANREPALAAGANTFIAKPYTLDNLLENLSDLVSR